MPKIVQSGELEKRVEIIGRFPEGAGLDEILAATGGVVSRRTLQRRLADLVAHADPLLRAAA